MRALIEALTIIALILATTIICINPEPEVKTLNQLHDLRGE